MDYGEKEGDLVEATTVPEGNRVAIFRITAELLHVVLRLPGDAKVTGFSSQVYFDQGCYAVRVESESFPLVAPGCAATPCNPLYRHSESGPEFVGWQMPGGAILSGADADCATPYVVAGG